MVLSILTTPHMLAPRLIARLEVLRPKLGGDTPPVRRTNR